MVLLLDIDIQDPSIWNNGVPSSSVMVHLLPLELLFICRFSVFLVTYIGFNATGLERGFKDTSDTLVIFAMFNAVPCV